VTAKERQRMMRLEIENAELRERVRKDMGVCADNLTKIIELKATLELIRVAMEDQACR
jgi:hypothetical protein